MNRLEMNPTTLQTGEGELKMYLRRGFRLIGYRRESLKFWEKHPKTFGWTRHKCCSDRKEFDRILMQHWTEEKTLLFEL